MNIKPIETSYKGYRFRSRTEARWAIVFDKLNLRWEYEKEGYDLPGYGWYLPDFYVPNQNILISDGLIVEVKGIIPTDIELNKANVLSSISELPVIVLSGVPGDHIWYLYFDRYHFNSTNNYKMDDWCSFAGIRTNKIIIKLAYEKARSARFEHGETP